MEGEELSQPLCRSGTNGSASAELDAGPEQLQLGSFDCNSRSSPLEHGRLLDLLAGVDQHPDGDEVVLALRLLASASIQQWGQETFPTTV